MTILIICEECEYEYETETSGKSHITSVCPECGHTNDIEIGDEYE